MARDQFNVDEADDFDDGTRAVSLHTEDDVASVGASDDENSRLTSTRKQRLAAGRRSASSSKAERASALRVKNWDAGDVATEMAGKVVKRSDLRPEEAEDSPDEENLADWSDAEPFGASEDEEEEGEEEEEEGEEEEEEDDEDSSGGEEEDAEQLIRGFEKEDAGNIMGRRDREKAVEKATHVRNQKIIWERCLEAQIYTKRLLTTVKSAAEDEDANEEDRKSAVEKLYECIDAVSELQSRLCNSAELTPPKSAAAAKKRKRSCDELWKDIVDENAAALPQYSDILNAYSRKTDLAAGAKNSSQAKKFRAVNQDILAQVESVLVDPQRVKRKAHAPADRTDGGHTSNEDDSLEDALDELMYDDADFYQQLLKEFIESGGGADGAQLQRTHRKRRKIVNRKASKGRQLRFNVHPKLENFMFPEPYPKPEMDVDELFRSLFGQRRQA